MFYGSAPHAVGLECLICLQRPGGSVSFVAKVGSFLIQLSKAEVYCLECASEFLAERPLDDIERAYVLLFFCVKFRKTKGEISERFVFHFFFLFFFSLLSFELPPLPHPGEAVHARRARASDAA